MVSSDYPRPRKEATALIPLPGPLRTSPALPFVGRSDEVAALRGLWSDVAREGRRIALIGGSPGSGKSRLAREFAAEAAAGGGTVLHGGCEPDARAPHRPLVDALEHLLRHADADLLRASIGPKGGDLARLLPELSARVGPLPPPLEADPDTERHRLHTAVTDLLAGIGTAAPVLLIVDDAHWADAATLHLLRHLARSGAEARVLVLVTFRDGGEDVRPEAASTFAGLHRLECVRRLHLGDLGARDVADLVSLAVGGGASAELTAVANAIADLTSGNPFLVGELWRALSESGAVAAAVAGRDPRAHLAGLASPRSVRELVADRVARLPPAAVEVVETAAVMGREAHLGRLRAASGITGEGFVDALDAAIRGGVVEDVPRPAPAVVFQHELVRRAVVDALPGLRRARLHLRIGEAMEHEPEGTRDPAALAHHFTEASPVSGVGRAVAHHLEAAESAMAAVAFESAADHLTTALGLGIEDGGRRAAARLRLGEAHRRAGRMLDALDAFDAAMEEARALGDGDVLAQAAVGYEEACWPSALDSTGSVRRLAEAERRLPDRDSPLRARVLASTARALAFLGEHSRAADRRRGAEAMARRLGDLRGIATSRLRAYWALGTTESHEAVLEALTEARDLAEAAEDVEIRTEAASWRVRVLVEMGEVGAARREVDALLSAAEGVGQPLLLHIAELFGSAIALLEGRLAAAEEMAGRSRDWARAIRARDPSGQHAIQMFSIRREQGRLGEVEPALRRVATTGAAGVWRPGLIALMAELGMHDEARAELAALREAGLDALPRDGLRLGGLCFLAEAAVRSGDAETAAALYEALAPWAGRNLVVGQLVACYGSADRHLGMLASACGRDADADAHLTAAAEANAAMGAETWLAHTLAEHGRALAVAGRREDAPRARALLHDAERLARRIGLPPVAARAEEARRSLRDGSVLPHGLSPREAEVLRLVASGASNRDIGRALVISEHTAANHVRSILLKTGSANRTEAAGLAHRVGLAAPPEGAAPREATGRGAPAGRGGPG